jgi:uncharacterized RmlC-like cupin family protein
MLLQRRVFRLEGESRDTSGNRVLLLSHPKTGQVFEIPVMVPNSERQRELEETLRILLREKEQSQVGPSGGSPREDDPLGR